MSAIVFAGCSTDFTPQTCAEDTDCGGGLVCELRDSQPVCVAATDAPLVIGHHSALSGNNQALGTNMKLGIQMAFDEANAAGGIRGRQLQLEYRDDVYDPATAEAAARALVDVQVMTGQTPHCPTTNLSPPVGSVAGTPAISDSRLARGPKAVLAMIGNVGTPTMVRAAPIVVETQTMFFGPFTGAGTILRDTTCGDCAKYIFNVRASYAQEARATLEMFKRKTVGGSGTSYTHLLSFDQNDTYGQAGYDGLKQAYIDLFTAFPGTADPTNPIVRFRYSRTDETSVPTQAIAAEGYLNNLLANNTGVQTVGIMMTDTYGTGTEFIRLIRNWQFGTDQTQNQATRLKIYFSNISFVGANELAKRLSALGTYSTPSGPVAYADGVVVSQVVPNYQSDTSDVVKKYNALIAASGNEPTFISLEGYIAARVFIEGLKAHKGPFVAETLPDGFENLPDLGLGFGAAGGFSPANHQYSNSVWGTTIQADGTFKNLYYWSKGIPIQFFE